VNENHQTVPKNRWAAIFLVTGVRVALLLVAYILSIGPVYYVWGRWSADMSTHETIEGFYSPLFRHGPQWLTEYRDASRIAGHEAAP
jgi:hypothetical protein